MKNLILGILFLTLLTAGCFHVKMVDKKVPIDVEPPVVETTTNVTEPKVNISEINLSELIEEPDLLNDTIDEALSDLEIIE